MPPPLPLNHSLVAAGQMLVNARFSKCTSLLWDAPQATEALRITSPELINFKIMDEIIPEPLGGAHSDPMGAFPAIKEAIMRNYHQYVTTLRCGIFNVESLQSPDAHCSALNAEQPLIP